MQFCRERIVYVRNSNVLLLRFPYDYDVDLDRIKSEADLLRWSYRVDMNTSSFTRLFITAPGSNEQAFSLTPTTWLEAQVAEPSELHRHIFAYKIYHQRERYLDALLQWRYLRQALDTFDHLGDLQHKTAVLSSIARAHADQKDFGEADRYWSMALDLYTQLSDYAGQELTILSMARSLSVRGKHRAALALLRKGYLIVQQRPWSRLTAPRTITEPLQTLTCPWESMAWR